MILLGDGTGAELSWVPADVLDELGIERYTRLSFRQASGVVVERWVGPAFIHAEGKRATDDVVFGEPGDLALLGARSLEGLNLRVEPSTKRLVDAGPVSAALAQCRAQQDGSIGNPVLSVRLDPSGTRPE